MDVDGVTFSYECRGEGSPIAFVEDGLGMPEEMGFDPAWHGWNTALNGMAELTTVCIYGRRGVGGTDPLAEGSVRTTSDQVDDLQSLWRALGVATPIVLVGHSVAGYNLRVATDRSADDVAGLVFLPGSEKRPDQAPTATRRSSRLRSIAFRISTGVMCCPG